MFSERINNWAKIFGLFAGTMRAIAIGALPGTGALHSTGPQGRSYEPSARRSALETQRDWAMANARLASANR
jgi:hypothetical protein